MSDSPGQRLALFRKSLGISQRAFAASLNVSGGLIGQLETDKDLPGRRVLLALSERYGLSADWLMHGTGEMQLPLRGFNETGTRIEPPEPGRPMGGDFVADGEPYAFVERRELSLSAGNGLAAAEGRKAGRMAFPVSWFDQRRLAPDLCIMVTVRGDSMEPTLPDGCLVLLSARENTPVDGGIFAMRLGDEIFVKRILTETPKADRTTTLIVYSDNRRFPPVVLRGPQLNDLRLIGRVRLVIFEP